MDDQDEFSLDITVRGKPATVRGFLRKSRFNYQFLFDPDGSELIVEKDDQGEWRAFAPGIGDGRNPPDPILVKAILEEIAKVFA